MTRQQRASADRSLSSRLRSYLDTSSKSHDWTNFSRQDFVPRSDSDLPQVRALQEAISLESVLRSAERGLRDPAAFCAELDAGLDRSAWPALLADQALSDDEREVLAADKLEPRHLPALTRLYPKAMMAQTLAQLAAAEPSELGQHLQQIGRRQRAQAQQRWRDFAIAAWAATEPELLPAQLAFERSGARQRYSQRASALVGQPSDCQAVSVLPPAWRQVYGTFSATGQICNGIHQDELDLIVLDSGRAETAMASDDEHVLTHEMIHSCQNGAERLGLGREVMEAVTELTARRNSAWTPETMGVHGYDAPVALLRQVLPADTPIERLAHMGSSEMADVERLSGLDGEQLLLAMRTLSRLDQRQRQQTGEPKGREALEARQRWLAGEAAALLDRVRRQGASALDSGPASWLQGLSQA